MADDVASTAGLAAGDGRDVGPQFDLTSDWHVDAGLERVWEAIRDVETWPEWWPSVAAVERLACGGPDGVAARYRVCWATALPYRLTIETEVARVDPLRAIEVIARGELQGRGLWTFDPAGGGTRVRYRWQVTPGKPWMRRLAPLLGWLFAWNHDMVMNRGRRGLARRLAQEAR